MCGLSLDPARVWNFSVEVLREVSANCRRSNSDVAGIEFQSHITAGSGEGEELPFRARPEESEVCEGWKRPLVAGMIVEREEQRLLSWISPFRCVDAEGATFGQPAAFLEE